MTRLREFAFIAVGLAVPSCHGQELLDEVNFRSAQFGGLHLVSLSVYSGYSTTAYPQAGFGLNAAPGAVGLGADESYGVSAAIGWQHHREMTNISVRYTGTYEGMVRYSGLNGYSQSLSLSASRMLTSRWTASLSASGQDATLSQFLYQPSALSVISGVPATLDDLAAALGAGQFTNAQAASMLTGAPIMQAPGRSLLLGNRVLSYSGQASLQYTLSSRLSFHLASFAAAGQTRFGGQDGVPASNYVMPRSLGATAGAGLNYSLSPRTQVGADVGENRTVNHFQSAYVSSASAFLGRKMGLHWFLRLQGGGTYTEFTQQTLGAAPKTRQLVGGGTLGYRARTYTLVATYDRSASDTFGFAVGTVTTISGAWNWHRPGSRWSLSTSFGEQQTRNTGFTSISGWQTTAGITANLNPHTTLSAQYVYLDSTGTYVGVFNSLALHSVRLTLGWAPQAVQR